MRHPLVGERVRKEGSPMTEGVKSKKQLVGVEIGLGYSGLSRPERWLHAGEQPEIRLQGYSDHLMKSLGGRQKSFYFSLKKLVAF